jgi:GNAT superfamily N-acetyltransferase
MTMSENKSDTVTTVVRQARVEESVLVAKLITAAFVNLAPTVWLLPDPSTRTGQFLGYMQMFTAHALNTGRIEVAADPHDDVPLAVALWWESPLTDPGDYHARLRALVDDAERFDEFDARLHAALPDQPHSYLGFLAVWPSYQGRGHGSVLLQHRHDELDEAMRPAFLVAASEDSRRLYLRHGYRDTSPLQLPAAGPRMWPMLRDPQA